MKISREMMVNGEVGYIIGHRKNDGKVYNNNIELTPGKVIKVKECKDVLQVPQISYYPVSETDSICTLVKDPIFVRIVNLEEPKISVRSFNSTSNCVYVDAIVDQKDVINEVVLHSNKEITDCVKDDKDRITHIRRGSMYENYRYDEQGRLVEKAIGDVFSLGSSNVSKYEYYEDTELIKEKVIYSSSTHSPTSMTVKTKYDKHGNVYEEQSGFIFDTHHRHYEYDKDNKLLSIEFKSSGTFGVVLYGGENKITKTYFKYNDRGEMLKKKCIDHYTLYICNAELEEGCE